MGKKKKIITNIWLSANDRDRKSRLGIRITYRDLVIAGIEACEREIEGRAKNADDTAR